MEKEMAPPESLASVNIKPDYPSSESYSSEPPPAYQRPKSASVQVAKIIAVTIVMVSLVFGGCMLASAYITANASCRHLEQELQLLTESMDRFQPLQPEALVQEEPLQKQMSEPLEVEESKTKEVKGNKITEDNDDSQTSEENSDSSNASDDSDEDEERVQIKLPIQIDFDDLAGAMMEKNQRSKMNCVVEKKRAEEFVDHQPKTVNLPFGLNLTTDPRYEKITGERIAIFCESGNIQSRQPEPQQPQQQEQDTIMIQPVMIPLSLPQFHTHMPMQAGMPMQQQMHPMEAMRPPMPNPMMQMQMQQQQQQPQQQQNQFLPNPILQHIAQQIIAQKLQQDEQRSQEEVQVNELRQDSQEQRTPLQRINIQQRMQRIPIPEEILSQINRLPNREVIVAVSQHEPEETPQELKLVQHQRSSAQGMNGRQTYARGLPLNMPVNIPVPMMQQVVQEPEAAASDEGRPHFLHPRSVRSVDELIPKSQKRVKRCNCDCAC